MNHRRRQLIISAGSAAAAAACGVPLSAQAQGAALNWPRGPVRIIVPNVPGGALDILARLLEADLSKMWRVPVIVEFKPGAGTITGTDFVAKSAPDGYTILMGAVSTHAINPALYTKMPYDAVRDFAPVTLVTSVPNVLVLHPSVPAASVKELVALAKAKPGQLNFEIGRAHV